MAQGKCRLASLVASACRNPYRLYAGQRSQKSRPRRSPRVSPQYVSKLLSGTENLSFKSVANIADGYTNDFRDRFCPVGKSSRKAALFYFHAVSVYLAQVVRSAISLDLSASIAAIPSAIFFLSASNVFFSTDKDVLMAVKNIERAETL